MEPDSRCFVSFTFSLLLKGQFCFVFLQCHRLPCSSFNFLIDECIYTCPFFVLFFFYCDQFWLNVITAVFQKTRFLFTIPHVSPSHARAWRAGGRSASRDPGTLMGIILSCWALHLIRDIASQQSGRLYCSVSYQYCYFCGLLCMPPCCWARRDLF